jgi:hypothetical protein
MRREVRQIHGRLNVEKILRQHLRPIHREQLGISALNQLAADHIGAGLMRLVNE